MMAIILLIVISQDYNSNDSNNSSNGNRTEDTFTWVSCHARPSMLGSFVQCGRSGMVLVLPRSGDDCSLSLSAVGQVPIDLQSDLSGVEMTLAAEFGFLTPSRTSGALGL